MDKIKEPTAHIWYAEQAAKNGWSRNVLVHQIESGLYQRQALAEKVSNFELRLPSPQSELAIQTMKDPYIFDFIPFKTDMLEREIEEALVKDVTKLLLELGTGFAFLGNQYHLNVGGDDFYIDLLFYNLNLRCYVVIELKTGEFKPEYAGQLNFYLSAVDGILKKEQDNPSVGLLLCKSKNDLVAEYSLKDMSKPIGVSAYQVTSKLPEELEKQLGREPTVDEIAQKTGLSRREVSAALESVVEPLSLEEPVYADGGDAVYVIDQVRDPDGEDSWISGLQFRQTVAGLTPREKRIMELRYLKGKTQMEVAREIGISQAQVSRLEKAALEQFHQMT